MNDDILREKFWIVKQEMMEQDSLKHKEEAETEKSQVAFGEIIGRKNAEALKMIMESTPPLQSIRPLVGLPPTAHSMTVGPLLMKWLPMVEHFTFRISPDRKNGGYVKGNCRVEFDDEDNLYFTKSSSEKKKFKGTNGLWELVTRIKPVDYSSSDLEAYSEVLEFAEAFYQFNDKTTRKTKPSRSEKYNGVIKKLWEAKGDGLTDPREGEEYQENDELVPSGFLVYSDAPVEVRLFSNYEDIQKINLQGFRRKGG